MKFIAPASQSICNMSVTSLRVLIRVLLGSGYPRYGSPDAPLDTCPLSLRSYRLETGVPSLGSFQVEWFRNHPHQEVVTP